jgi:hypothetical protein
MAAVAEIAAPAPTATPSQGILVVSQTSPLRILAFSSKLPCAPA